ncbi:MAG: carboxymuconolactone decarboxylase family protein [Pseudomonadota bacterium]
MTSFPLHTSETAPEASKPHLERAQKAFGFVPNLFAGLATSPVAVEAYGTLSSIFAKSSLNATERQIVTMTNNRLNGCTYCMAAHTTSALAAGVPESVVGALRKAQPLDDEKLEALRQFSIVVNEKRGQVSGYDLTQLTDAGYSQETALEVIVATALKVISNYANHLLNTPTDDQFSANSWLSAETA